MTTSSLVAEHRNHYVADLWLERLVARQPPTSLDLNTGRLHEEPAAAIGMNMAGRLLKYVGHPEGFGSEFPWTKALWRLKYHCRREHPFHRAGDRPYWRGSLCWSLVHMCVVREFSIENAAKILRYDNPEPVLRYALAFIESSMDEARARAEKRQRELSGQFSVGEVTTVEHHAVPGMHQQECPQCLRRNAA
jgi:hypothetical protein